ncbi:hypothetical protein [Deefgea salmonis]|uniref:Uncharacterized protein n=1 Tax=Deefgea salmonis TaxID=2875502 RepID=A0ABS8BLJ0_9NEIS|nr:hypothetical protein [Deefgea salmonis]MCB5196477.1 hypothetical protein [Deefgea salmonis]
MSATASIVRSEGTDEVGADAGGCFGVKGALQKQSPIPARAAERAPKITRRSRIKQNRRNKSGGCFIAVNVGLRKLSPTYGTTSIDN